MPSNPIVLLGICTFAASIPVGIWLYILFSKSEKSKKIVALVFLIGCLTAPALLGLQYLWDIFPRFNLAAFIEESITTQSRMYIAMFILFAAMEEIIKHYVVSSIDRKTLLITKIDDAIRYSIAAALGFSFTENIYYLYEFWPSISTGELIQMYIFRSIFTACAHMIFSGVFGYYYGVGKFSIEVRQQKNLVTETSKITKIIANIFNLPVSQALKQQLILKGLFIAIFIHAVYNYLLQYNIILPVLGFVVLGYIYLRFLLSRKAGHLILMTDISTAKKGALAKKDEEVVLELLGMWFKEKKYVDVIHICERLLQRDPDNKVVNLFKAKALDQLDLKDHYRKILGSVIKSSSDISDLDRSIIEKHIQEKEELEKVKMMVEKQLKKEGKFKEPAKKTIAENNPSETSPENSPQGAIVDKYAQGDSFKINL